MKCYPYLIAAVGFFGLLAGCATHTYRSDDGGTTLYLRNAKAKAVVLFSSTDGFIPHPAERKGNNWVNHIAKTFPTMHEFTYFYTVDGNIFLPDCRFKEKDGFGNENCICITAW